MDVLIPFAKDKATGTIVAVDEVKRGKACNCVCLFCDLPVVANQGEINRPYFSHEAKAVSDEPCPINFERAVFWMCREIFESSNQITLPEYQLKQQDSQTNLAEVVLITQSSVIQYHSAQFPAGTESNLRDVVILNIGKHRLAVTLGFKGKDRSEAYYYEGVKTSHISIELSSLYQAFKKQNNGFRSHLTDVLLNQAAHKHWNYHPRQENAVQLFSEKCKQRHEELKAKRDAANQAYIAQLKERDRRAEKQRQRQQLIQVTSAIDIKNRCELLVKTVIALKNAGHIQVKTCDNCKFSQPVELEACQYCHQHHFKLVTLDDYFIKGLANKYWQWSYAENSLVAVRNKTK
ncbi:hypothetical protein WNY63_17785 [Pseudoalteromonas neustonica]|uniref:Uncharacterized protein n=1 Tax=Pseudoalteromonas neustonica TaxID=1840331 RepID=A0ABU9U864_9GAMM